MKPIRLVVIIDSPPDRVWAELADLRSHEEWMSDARSIELIGDSADGVGTRMRVATRIGPFRTSDIMTVVAWEETRLISVAHEGAVTGLGSFAIHPLGPKTQLTWTETLHFPWWLGGRLGLWLARPILRRRWSRNLERLRHRVEVSGP